MARTKDLSHAVRGAHILILVSGYNAIPCFWAPGVVATEAEAPRSHTAQRPSSFLPPHRHTQDGANFTPSAHVSGRTRWSIEPLQKLQELHFMLDAHVGNRYLHHAWTLRDSGYPLVAAQSRDTARDRFIQRRRHHFDGVRDYAQRFPTVEVDTTFYACPSTRSVANWNARTPDEFIFAVKVPLTITHERVLVDCDPLHEFLATMDLLAS